jgi:hypothetical protein
MFILVFMALFAGVYCRVVPKTVRNYISLLVGNLSGSSNAIKDLQTQITDMGFHISDLTLELTSKYIEISEKDFEISKNAKVTIALLNSRENRIHDFVQSALAIVAKNLDDITLVSDENTNCELGKYFDLFGSDKNSRHSYAQLYENLLSKKDAPSILEIGIGSLNPFPYAGLEPGCSLNAWRKRYPAAFIVGADIDPESVQQVSEIGYVVDQTDSTSLDALSKNLEEHGLFDLIIDDGFHDPHANIQTLIQILPHLDIDGTYVIEDVHCSLINFWRVIIATLGLNGEVLDMSSLRPQTDDNVLITIRRK